jgi:Ras-related protein Rab-2A
MTIMLVGNKGDLEHRRQVSKEEGQKFADEHGLIFLETSAKTAANVEEAFIQTAQKIYESVTSGALDAGVDAHGVKLGSDVSRKDNASGGKSGSSKNSGGCC